MEGLRKFYAGWLATLPGVAASLTTTAILFGLSLFIPAVKETLFPPKTVKYPLSCISVPVAVPANSDRIIEFYVVNPTAEDYSEDALKELLAEKLAGTRAAETASARIALVYDRAVGTLVSAEADGEFNGDNGVLDVLAEGNNVRIGVDQIAPHTIVRARMTYTGLDNAPVKRDQKGTIPFKFDDLETACYSRG